MQKLLYVTVGMVLGGLVTASMNAVVAEPEQSPAYLVVGGRTLDADGMGPYIEAATPLAQAAGLQILARDTVTEDQVLEGAWPYEGTLTIEKFDSLDAVMAFWHSDAYQEAKKLRDGKVELDFVVAITDQAQN
jgi:uncharacterized protein (DUF1330 family)